MTQQSLTPKAQKEIRQRILSFLLLHGGYLRKKVATSSKILFGRLIDPPIWKELSLQITPLGLCVLELTTSSSPSTVPEGEWELGDEVLGYLIWSHFAQNRWQIPPLLYTSTLVQMMAFPFCPRFHDRETWAAFLRKGGHVFLTYGEGKIARLWSHHIKSLFKVDEQYRGWTLAQICRFFSLLMDLFQKEGFPHLFHLLLACFQKLFPSPQSREKFMTHFPWPEEASEEMVWQWEDQLNSLFSIPEQIETLWQETTSKHPLEQTPSEALFLERYGNAYE